MKAFTLLELIVVMGIAAVLVALGLQGMVTFRYSTEFSQAYSEIITVLRSIQNSARTSQASEALLKAGTPLPDAKVDAYALHFDSADNYSVRYCFFVGTNRLDCSGVEESNIKSGDFSDVQVLPTDLNKCRNIAFLRVSGDVVATTTDVATMDNLATCTIGVTHRIGPSLTRSFTVDLANNNINAAL